MVVAEVGTTNAELLSVDQSESGRGAEAAEEEDTAAIVCWPATGFIFFLSGIFFFFFMHRRRRNITKWWLPFKALRSKEYVFCSSLQQVP